MNSRRTTALLVLLWGAGAATASVADASCHLYPGVKRTYSSWLGTTNRPFAAPGEALEIHHRSCDTRGAAPQAEGEDNVVTVAFPSPDPNEGASLVFLTDFCDDAFLAEVASCEARRDVLEARCAGVPEGSLETLEGGDTLRFPFPDTLAIFGGEGRAGPARIAVSRRGVKLPCDLARKTCGDMSRVDICVDEFFEDDSACDTASSASLFGHFTALPRPNEFSETCFRDEGLCSAKDEELRLAADTDGNLFLAIDWTGVLAAQKELPIPRLVRAAIDLPMPFNVPDEVFVGSFTADGGRLPPIFTPLFGDGSPEAPAVALFGSADAPYTILRFARNHGTCAGGDDDGELCETGLDCAGALAECLASCVGDPEIHCLEDADCPGSLCGSLFDESLDDLLTASESGPATMPLKLARPEDFDGVCRVGRNTCDEHTDCAVDDVCVVFALSAEDAVPLDGILETELFWSLTFDEAIDGTNRNGDDDFEDDVFTIRPKSSGDVLPLDPPACAAPTTPPTGPGRTTLRLEVPASEDFTFPAVSAQHAWAAFLEGEADINTLEGPCDLDGDGETTGVALSMTGLVYPGQVFTSDLATVNLELRVDGDAHALSADLTGLADLSGVVDPLLPAYVSFARFGYPDLLVESTVSGPPETDVVVLGVLDPNVGFRVACASGDVATANGAAVFLRPEDADDESFCEAVAPIDAAGVVGTNDDGDELDEVVHGFRYSDSEGKWVVRGLGLAATGIDLSTKWIAALAPEGAEPTATNLDGDALDAVVFLRRTLAASSWENLGYAADSIALVDDPLKEDDDVLLFRVPEGAQGVGAPKSVSPTGNNLFAVVPAEPSVPTATELGDAIDFVAGSEEISCPGSGRIVRPLAFTTPQEINGEPATKEAGLVVFNTAVSGGAFRETAIVVTNSAVYPCDSYKCGAREPYRVEGAEIRYLTDEAEQGTDLDGDPETDNIVLQIFDVCSAVSRVVGAVDREALKDLNPLAQPPAIISDVLTQNFGRCIEDLSCPAEGDCHCPIGSFRKGENCIHAAPASCKSIKDCGRLSDSNLDATCKVEVVAIAVSSDDTDGDGTVDSADECDDDGDLAGPCVDGLFCRRAREVSGVRQEESIEMVDVFGDRQVTPHTLDAACRTVGLSGAEPNSESNHAALWKTAAERIKNAPEVQVRDMFGLHTVALRRSSRVLLPLAVGMGASVADPEVGYQCYDVREVKPDTGSRGLTLDGETQAKGEVDEQTPYKIRKLKRLCVPAGIGLYATIPSKPSWLCYRGRRMNKTDAMPWPDASVPNATDILGGHSLALGRGREVCVRAQLSMNSLNQAPQDTE